MIFSHVAADLGQQRGHDLRLDGEDQHLGVLDHLQVVGGDHGAGLLVEAIAGLGIRVAGPQRAGRNEPGILPALRQGGGHLTGPEEADLQRNGDGVTHR